MSKQIPCVCDEDSFDACDWEVEIKVSMRRATDVGSPAMTVHLESGLSEVMAASTCHTVVASVNNGIAHVYKKKFELCAGENDERVKMMQALF